MVATDTGNRKHHFGAQTVTSILLVKSFLLGDVLLKAIRADWATNHELRIRVFLVAFRIAHEARTRGLVGLPLVVLYKMISALAGIEIPSRTRIGFPLHIQHGYGLVIHGNTVIGDRCVLKQGVTLGVRKGNDGASPTLGHGVHVGANAIVLGGVTLGDRALIGAGAIVLDDVPAAAKAMSPKARVFL